MLWRLEEQVVGLKMRARKSTQRPRRGEWPLPLSWERGGTGIEAMLQDGHGAGWSATCLHR